MNQRILTRPIPQRAREMLVQQGLHPVLAQLYAARGVLEEGVVLLAKPFTGPTLLAKVRSVLDG